MSAIKTDILIIGGGIAGCIAAISLVDTHRVTLIDKLSEPRERIGESLAPASHRILKELNLLDDLENQSGSLYQQNIGMKSHWGSDQVHIIDHLSNPDGFVKSLDRKAFEKYLRLSAEKRGVNCIWGSKLQSCSSVNGSWHVQLKSNNESSVVPFIEASFVVDASGRQSHFARSLGIKRQVKDQLIACWITFPNTEENTMSTISASEIGWWYSSVVPKGERIVAFHTDSDLINKNELKTTASFLKLAEGNHPIKDLLITNEQIIELQGTVSANSTKLEQVAGQNWVALGDAAVSFDPLSSQGMFNAMASAMQLRDLILQFGFTWELSETYTYQIEQIWIHYLKHKRTFYKAETRWPKAEFWKRRHED